MAGENWRARAGPKPTFFGSEAHHSTTAPYLQENKKNFEMDIYFFFAKFYCLLNIPRQYIQNARICFISFAA